MLLDAFSGELEEDEDECIGVATNDTSYVPASLLKRLGYKIVKAEESGEWGVVRREGAAEEVRRRGCRIRQQLWVGQQFWVALSFGGWHLSREGLGSSGVACWCWLLHARTVSAAVVAVAMCFVHNAC
jgi:hypothetical protein